MSTIETDAELANAVEFLAAWPGDAINVTGIHPDTGKLVAYSFCKDDDAKAALLNWLQRGVSAGYGIYSNYNALRVKLSKAKLKAYEKEVSTVYAFHVDADVDKSITDPAAFEIAKADLLERIKGAPKPPSVIIDSGNGFGLFWILTEPVKVTDGNRDILKAINTALANECGGDNCQNLDRVMRVPFTINYPNAAKRKRNRPAVPTRVVSDMRDFAQYRVEDFEPAPEKDEPQTTAEAIDVPASVDLSRLDPDFRKLIVEGQGEQKFGDGSRSDYTYYVAAELRRLDFSDGAIVSVIINPDYKVSAHILDQKQRDPVAQASRIIADMNKKGVERDPAPKEEFAEPAEPLTKEQMKAATAFDRPSVELIDAKLPKNVREVQDNLIKAAQVPNAATSDQVFQRGGELVHLSRNKLKPRKPGEVVDKSYHVQDDLLVKSATDGWLTDRSMRAMKFYRMTDNGPKAVAVPARVVKLLGEISTSWKFPKLVATVEAPTLRPDGSLLQAEGYDKRSGLYLDMGGVSFPPIKDEPTKEDALAALAILKKPLADFPFRDPDDKLGLSLSVQLSAMLTAAIRRSLPTAPTFGFGANDMSAGKTQLAQVNAIMATGRRTGERPFTSDPDEQRKLLSAAFAAGDSAILFDNVDVDIQGGPLCSAITGQVITTRRLGGNSADDQITAPTCALIMFTGNRLTAAGDMTSRVLVCLLFIGKAFDAAKFKYQPLDDYLMARRPTLVAAALTIMRAYIAAGSPKVEGKRSRFPEWQRLASDPLIWLGEVDPCLAFDRAMKADPAREQFANVLRGWLKLPDASTWRTTAQLLDAPNVAQAIADARGVELARLTPRNAAEYLKTMTDKSVEGWRLEKRGGTLKMALNWRLVPEQ